MVDKSSDRPGGGDGGLSRRDLLVGAGTVLLAGGLAACGGSGGSSGATGGSTAAGTPKRGGNFRLAVTGGGASDIIDGRSASLAGPISLAFAKACASGLARSATPATTGGIHALA